MFTLHPQLAKDTLTVGHFALSQVLLAKDANYPWCILVPKRDDICEIHHLDEQDQMQLIKESSVLARVMEQVFTPDKMNVAAIGNRVSQLHVHHVARFKDDAVWPKPIWGALAALDYPAEQLSERLDTLRNALTNTVVDFYE